MAHDPSMRNDRAGQTEIHELLELSWLMRSVDGRIVSCAIYRNAAPGVEVWCRFPGFRFIHTRRLPNLDDARRQAAAWQEAAIASGCSTLREWDGPWT